MDSFCHLNARPSEYSQRLQNPAVLPEGWSQQTMVGRHVSHPYNPDIANTFFRAGEIEAWGRGIERIFAACRKAGTPKPRLRFDAGGIWTEFAFGPNYLKAISTPASATKDNNLGRGEKLTPNRRKILDAMRADPSVTYKALIELVGIGATNIDKNIRALKEAGLIRRIGPAKGGRWEVIL